MSLLRWLQFQWILKQSHTTGIILHFGFVNLQTQYKTKGLHTHTMWFSVLLIYQLAANQLVSKRSVGQWVSPDPHSTVCPVTITRTDAKLIFVLLFNRDLTDHQQSSTLQTKLLTLKAFWKKKGRKKQMCILSLTPDVNVVSNGAVKSSHLKVSPTVWVGWWDHWRRALNS